MEISCSFRMDYPHLQQDDLEPILCGEKKPGSLDLQLLRQITGNFSDDRRIGKGGCGQVYKVNVSFFPSFSIAPSSSSRQSLRLV